MRAVEALLVSIYTRVEPNWRPGIGTQPSDFKTAAYGDDLAGIFQLLETHRGFRGFVKARRLPPCDFFIPSPGFLVEIDEKQHFTTFSGIQFLHEDEVGKKVAAIYEMLQLDAGVADESSASAA